MIPTPEQIETLRVALMNRERATGIDARDARRRDRALTDAQVVELFTAYREHGIGGFDLEESNADA